MLSRYKSIVIAIDSSDDSNHVLEAVQELGERDAVDYHVITVIPPVATAVAGMDAAAFAASWPLQDLEDEITKNATSSVKQRVADHGISTDRVHVRHGKPSSVIHAFAEEVEADLIVVGSHGRTGFGRLVLGSTANAVLHGSPCDVLTIRFK